MLPILSALQNSLLAFCQHWAIWNTGAYLDLYVFYLFAAFLGAWLSNIIYMCWICLCLYNVFIVKSTKFGPKVAETILLRFLMGAKMGGPWGGHIGDIQYGHQLRYGSIIVKNPKGPQSRMIPIFRGFWGQAIWFRSYFNNLRSRLPLKVTWKVILGSNLTFLYFW